MNSTLKRACAVLSSVSVLASALPCSAQATNKTHSQATAEILFEQARKLILEKKYDEACPKLAESQRLDPGGGTLLNLAVCHEEQGRTGSAWTEFNEALAWAIKDGRDVREKLAREHIKGLENKLNRLAVTPAKEGRVPGLEVKVDGVAMGEAAWGLPTPTDPGEHQIEASAPGYWTWHWTVKVDSTMERLEMEVPALQAKLNDPADMGKAHRDVPLEMSRTRRYSGYGLIGLGVAGVAVGSLFGVLTLSKKSEADQGCRSSDKTCNPSALLANEAALSNSYVSSVGFGVGLAAAAVGTYLLITGTPSSASGSITTGQLKVVPNLGPYGGGMTLNQTW